MKTLLSLLIIFHLAFQSSAFEGIVHCTKTQNGQVSTFDFYIKGSKIVVKSEDGVAKYQLILDQQSNELFMCIDHPEFKEKGYYHYTKENTVKNSSLQVISKKELQAITLRNEQCKGYQIVTDNGSAIAYVGSSAISLRGFSLFLNDPIYELIDQFQLNYLPVQMAVSTSVASYSITLESEAMTLDDALFQIPAGYKEFVVSGSNE